MSAKHREHTISFRPTQWERAIIYERASLSGLNKKDFITRSCIYGNIVVTGTRENISRIISELQVMEEVLLDVAGQLKLGNVPVTEESFREMREEYLALIITVVDILKGASYLYDVEFPSKLPDWKKCLDSESGEEKTSVVAEV